MNFNKGYTVSIVLVLISIALFLFFLGGFGGNRVNTTSGKNHHTKIEIEKHLIDIGKIKKGGLALAGFKIVNIGVNPLIIKDVTVDCHCTVVEWSKDPLLPGDSVFIKVRYDAAFPGFFLKKVTVYSNAYQSPVLLVIRGEITW